LLHKWGKRKGRCDRGVDPTKPFGQDQPPNNEPKFIRER
jgi:hypothetical protein